MMDQDIMLMVILQVIREIEKVEGGIQRLVQKAVFHKL